MLLRALPRVSAGLWTLAACLMILLVDGADFSAAGGCKLGTINDQNPPKACWRPFSAESPFNRKLPESPPQVTGSPLIGLTTADFGAAPYFEAGASGTGDDYDHPVYFSSKNDPVYEVQCVAFGGGCEIRGDRVHIPKRAKPAGGSDGHLGVIDQSSGWQYDFWQVRDRSPEGGPLVISFGGRTRIGSPGSDGLGSPATAAHFATSAGAIRAEELRAGEIDHALFMTVPCTNGRSVWPAGDGVGSVCSKNLLAPAMGQHLFLDMSNQEIEGMDVPGWQKTIFLAMANYGLFVGDTGGDGWGLKLWTGSLRPGGPDPWVQLAQRLNVPSYVADDGTTRYSFDMRQSLDWSLRLRVAEPCVSRRTC